MGLVPRREHADGVRWALYRRGGERGERLRRAEVLPGHRYLVFEWLQGLLGRHLIEVVGRPRWAYPVS